MADLSDVETALVSIVAGILYPSGTSQASAVGIPCKVYAGWPSADSLDQDLAAGIANITVFPRPEERNTTRFPTDWQDLSINPATFTLTGAGQTITVGGAQPSPFYSQNVVIFVNELPFIYPTISTDTPSTIAAALQALIAASVAGVTVSGAVITLPGSARMGALRVGTTGTQIKEVRRQERRFQITVWADTPAHRDAVAKPIDATLADTARFTLSDQSVARLKYVSSPVIDALQKAKLYRRDFFYSVEFPTTLTQAGTQITVEKTDISPKATDATQYDATFTTYF